MNVYAGRIALGLGVVLFGWGLPLVSAAPGGPPVPPLSTLSDSPRLPGKFVWADLVTDDLPAATKFYSQVFGWKFMDLGGYFIALNEELPVGGMFSRSRPAGGTAEPRWFGYLSVPSVSRAQSAVLKAGGRVLAAPQTIPKRGEQAVFADPEGAVFGVVKSSSGDPPDYLADPGEWIWIQMLSREARKSADFYQAVAGYEVVENTQGSRLSDYVLTSEGYARATIRTIPDSNTTVKPTWLPFVRVRSVTETISRAKQAGGQVRIEPRPELLDGKVAVIADPTGAAVGILEWSDEWMKGGR